MTQPNQFADAYGFMRNQVQLNNWRNSPWNVWAFRHVPEFIPTAEIRSYSVEPEDPAVAPHPLTEKTVTLAGEPELLVDVLRRTWTDALVVMKSGRFIAEFHAPQFDLQTSHILFSSSKSITGLLVGLLVGDGLIDLDTPVATYVPELERSAFGNASIQHVLDMRTSVAFTEEYGDSRGDFARYRRAGLLDPQVEGHPRETVIEFLASLKQGTSEHGGPFHYCSPNSDVLGLVVERASGERLPDFAARRLWRPLGLRQSGSITVDAEGTPRAGGGISMTPRDLARIGEAMRCGGRALGRQVIPSVWVTETISGGDPQAWGKGNFSDWLPGGSYRNQWYQSGNAHRAFFTLGIHGQWLYVDPQSEVVIVKFSSQPNPVDALMKMTNLYLFNEISNFNFE
ncbi:serine hydrolase domain-containing protein [Acetobacter nitrogenifigens]|uniref:6-aminohexanoate-dimer hydrolase n=1 Tax=Acetobacter nitrogenifigens DSM 23921 = NBRC 105050 TaxID=1120919 RepID=A0A511XBR9_9PROT|nr:serine hydrolase [Acetobacter nitrogenifigens]GEN60417.1 6-aminohexanoate-dimer hydrolase [Acetobacter nitrogenifigens DSM 23921 = NBRC 105050]